MKTSMIKPVSKPDSRGLREGGRQPVGLTGIRPLALPAPWALMGIWLLFLGLGNLEAGERGLLFEIVAPGGAPCYLYGTMHSEDPRVLTLSTATQDAFERSPVFIMETVPDAQAVIRSMMTMVYTDGRGLAGVTGEPLYGRAVKALAELGMTEEAVKDFKPWAAATLLGMPKAETGEFLDIRLYKAAQASSKQVIGLETIEEQLAVFDSLSEQDQVALLRETLDARDQLTEVFERLLGAYLARDLAGLALLGDEYLRQGDPELAARFRRAALEVRNQRMAERLGAHLRAGGCFIAVGALHLPGAEGILRHLAAAGFQVRAVD